MTEKQTIIIETAKDPKYAVICLHGLGASSDDLAVVVPLLSIEGLPIRFIFPNAPIQKVTLNGGIKMPAWYDILGLSADSPQDAAGIQAAEKLIHAIIEEQLIQGIPAENIVLAGFSQGGALALYTGLRYPKPLAGIMALSTYLPLHEELKVSLALNPKPLPIFMSHGDADPVLPLSFAEMAKDLLSDLGYPLEYKVYSKGHTFCFEELLDIRNWLQARQTAVRGS